jgi:hypothetical protein
MTVGQIQKLPAVQREIGDVADILRVRLACREVTADEVRGLRRGRVRNSGAVSAAQAHARQTRVVSGHSNTLFAELDGEIVSIAHDRGVADLTSDNLSLIGNLNAHKTGGKRPGGSSTEAAAARTG